MFYDWATLRIDTRGRAAGELKTLCPVCSANRRHKHDRCLSVNVTEGVYNCAKYRLIAQGSERQFALRWITNGLCATDMDA
jgi:hypothetical protein